MHFPTDSTAHTPAFDGSVMDHWLDQKIIQTANASAMQDRSAMQDPNLYSRVLYCLSYVPPPKDTHLHTQRHTYKGKPTHTHIHTHLHTQTHLSPSTIVKCAHISCVQSALDFLIRIHISVVGRCGLYALIDLIFEVMIT